MTDLVERLRMAAANSRLHRGDEDRMHEAADEIERLHSCLYAQEDVKPLYDEIERLRQELAELKEKWRETQRILR